MGGSKGQSVVDLFLQWSLVAGALRKKGGMNGLRFASLRISPSIRSLEEIQARRLHVQIDHLEESVLRFVWRCFVQLEHGRTTSSHQAFSSLLYLSQSRP